MNGHTSEGCLSISGLSLSFGEKRILSDISFDVPRGRMACVVGRNGTGKSSLFKCIAGVIQDFTGDISIGGLPLKKMSGRERARHISYVPQGSPDDIPYSVKEFMDMARYPWMGVSSKPSDERAVAEAMEMSGITHLSSRSMSALSGGERQKVMIASAIAQESGIILMDEPTTYLDYAHQAEAIGLIRTANTERGSTVLLVTHDLNMAMEISDRIIAMRSGTIEWSGPPAELATRTNFAGLAEIFGVEFERFVPEMREGHDGNERIVLVPSQKPQGQHDGKGRNSLTNREAQ